MKRERRKEVKDRVRYFASGLVENEELIQVSEQFDDFTDEEKQLAQDEMVRISKRIWPDEVEP
ncbi:hypothetical protein [Pseudomonas typographi]|uniref:Uncharacterized protein n=1 Tax=Pseudomonas typographi TaxID=2715964 RepID=A0ABR7ZAR2_9PSED|nr:hypothetical protein [Pseudomonas typographi]MBD1602408.1 hypothetical protein [Pseudomonas typographi]